MQNKYADMSAAGNETEGNKKMFAMILLRCIMSEFPRDM